MSVVLVHRHLPARRISIRIGLAVCAGLLSAASLAAPAQADIIACRSDPVVTLSNGVTLDLSADIADSATDVRQVTYILHAPRGTQVLSVVGTDGALGLTERFAFFADTAPHVYATETVVDTQTQGIGVTATTVVAPPAAVSTAVSVVGQDHQPLRVSNTA